MNKQKFVDFLRRPHNISDKDLEDIQQTINDAPYFQSARTVLAKASKIKGLPQAKTEITRASIYATDRGHLKKYILDDLIFLRPLDVHDSHEGEKKRAKQEETTSTDQTKQLTKSTVKEQVKDQPVPVEPTKEELPVNQPETSIPQEDLKPVKTEETTKENVEAPELDITVNKDHKTAAPQPTSSSVIDQSSLSFNQEPESDLDHLIEDIFNDIKELKKNRAHLVELEKKIEEEDAVNDAVEKATKKAQEKTEKKTIVEPDERITASESEENTENTLLATEQSEIQEKTTENSDTPADSTDTTGVKIDEEIKETSSDTLAEEEKPVETPPKRRASRRVSSRKLIDKTDSKNVEISNKPIAKKTSRKKPEAKKIDTSTDTANQKVVKGESALEKAAAKMRASGKIKEDQGPEIKKGESKVNNTPPEKIIKTYIRKRSSERKTKGSGGSSEAESSGGSDDKPGPAPSVPSAEIIDQFIKNQPSITPKKENTELSLGDLSELSTSFNPEVASEYLAEIFLEQGKEDKAISIYEQLILKFPDKSTYFADIIEKLKD